MNVLSATGNLGRDCRTNEVNGTAVCNFPVAVKAGFGKHEQTLWLDCALWGKQAESRLPEYLLKGQQVAVSGELSTQEKDGKTYLKLRCNSVDLVGGSGGSKGGGSGDNGGSGKEAEGGSFDDLDDEIPF
jgi:single-strand DNA-binding protein